MLRTATRRAMLYPEAVAAESGWWSWLDASYTVVGAYDFRSAASLADATKIGSTPSVVQQPGGGLNLGALGLTCNEDTVIDTGITGNDAYSAMALIADCDTSGSRFLMGAQNNSPLRRTLQIGPHWGPTYAIYGVNQNAQISAPYLTDGTIGIASFDCYVDGSNVFTVTDAGSEALVSIYVGASNNAGTINAIWLGVVCALAITSDTISEADMATLHTLMSA